MSSPASALAPAHVIVLTLVAAVIACAGVSYPLYDADLWQHLCVGRAIWSTGSIPHTNAWTWPTHGEPYVLPSWLFRALLWPCFRVGGEAALTAWRWLTTLAIFAIAGATAWRAGARGATMVVALLWCALLYRLRCTVRPESLVYVLLAAQMWILETRRRGGRDASLVLVPIAWAWANIHVSYYLTLMLTGFHLLAELPLPWRRHVAPGTPRATGRLALVLAASAAMCFVNPFGWRALWQPFQFFLEWRHQPIYQSILELRPIFWPAHQLDGLAPWMLLALGLAVARIVRRRGDLVDGLVYLAFFASALNSERLLGFLCVAAAPIFARDLCDLVAGIPLPGVLRSAWTRTVLACVLMVAGAIPQLRVEPWRPGWGIAWKTYPVRACDWIAAHGVRGRSFGAFHQAGYQLWRFWPQRDRLPFMDIHQTGTRADQDLYAACWSSDPEWRTLETKYRFDWVLLPRAQYAGQDLVDRMDADSTWALVFVDDASALFLRRDGAGAALAARWRYRIVPAGDRALGERFAAAQAGAAARADLRAELDRQVRESEWTSRAHSALATLDILDHRWPEALDHLRRTQAIDPKTPLLQERLQVVTDSVTAMGPARAR